MAEEEDLYESLPPSTTAATHMFAGALAGIGEHCVMYPFDCVKVKQISDILETTSNYDRPYRFSAVFVNNAPTF